MNERRNVPKDLLTVRLRDIDNYEFVSARMRWRDALFPGRDTNPTAENVMAFQTELKMFRKIVAEDIRQRMKQQLITWCRSLHWTVNDRYYVSNISEILRCVRDEEAWNDPVTGVRRRMQVFHIILERFFPGNTQWISTLEEDFLRSKGIQYLPNNDGETGFYFKFLMRYRFDFNWSIIRAVRDAHGVKFDQDGNLRTPDGEIHAVDF